MTKANQQITSSPLSCPRCGCPDSKVISSRRKNRSSVPEPLPALQRVRKCDHCEKQYRTDETIHLQDLRSAVWRVLVGDRVITDPLPEGVYYGQWTRYEVTVSIGDQVYTLCTRNDMLSEKYPCQVTVGPHRITVESGSL